MDLLNPKDEPCDLEVYLNPYDTVISRSNSRPLGRLSKRDANILKTLQDDPDIELQIHCRVEKTYGRARNGNRAVSIACISVIIYGTMELFDPVGELFEENDLFIQDPVGCDRVVEYRNPHRLSGLDERPTMTSNEPIHPNIMIECASNPVDILSEFETSGSLAEAEDPLALCTPLHR